MQSVRLDRQSAALEPQRPLQQRTRLVRRNRAFRTLGSSNSEPPAPHQFLAAAAMCARLANAWGSLTAISASILRLMSTPAARRPAMSRL